MESHPVPKWHPQRPRTDRIVFEFWIFPHIRHQMEIESHFYRFRFQQVLLRGLVPPPAASRDVSEAYELAVAGRRMLPRGDDLRGQVEGRHLPGAVRNFRVRASAQGSRKFDASHDAAGTCQVSCNLMTSLMTSRKF